MTADLGEFKEIARRSPPRCVVAKAFDYLEPQDAVNLQGALEAPEHEIGHNTIATWLKKRGLGGAQHVVKSHRQGVCCCER